MTLPISSEISLKHGNKPISACALDEAGARLLTGGDDYQLKFWDFPGMTQTLEPFRYLEPQEGHQIRSLSYSYGFLKLILYLGLGPYKKRNLRFFQTLIKTPSGDYKQVSEEF